MNLRVSLLTKIEFIISLLNHTYIFLVKKNSFVLREHEGVRFAPHDRYTPLSPTINRRFFRCFILLCMFFKKAG